MLTAPTRGGFIRTFNPYCEAVIIRFEAKPSTPRDEPDHDALCEREQRDLLKAIRENVDLSDHMSDAIRSLRIALAADRWVRTGEVVRL